MKKLNKILAIIFCFITVLTAIYLKDIKVLSFLLFIGVIFILRLKDNLRFIFLIYGFLGIYLGFLLHLYKLTTWYDTFVHFLAGIFLPFIGIYILNLFKMFNKKKIIFNIIYIVLFVIAISSFWEIVEFIMDNIFNSDMQRKATGVNDTMKDIISAFLGTVLFNIWFIYEYKNKKILYKFIDSMIGENYGR